MSGVSFLNIVCFKWGDRYPAKEVNILKSMVDRNLTVDHCFHCITDDTVGLDKDIITHPLPQFSTVTTRKKLWAYSDNFLGLQDQFIVMFDIDLVIIGNIDFLADEKDKDYIVARLPRDPDRTHTAIFRLKVGSTTHVWENYIADPDLADKATGGRVDVEQMWTESQLSNIDYFPDGKIVSFKYDCNSRTGRIFGKTGAMLGLTLSHFGEAQPPKGAAIVSFHGMPLPRDVMGKRYLQYRRAPFVSEHWHE